MTTAEALIPADADLAELARIAAGCTACDLHERATQTVFGEGPARARMLVAGEQPGDREDRQGAPFVGPAGLELDRALDAVGIDRGEVYVTNVVKHFKWKPRGKRRIHQKPTNIEIRACLPWLRAEIARLDTEVVVGLGATAAQAMLGRSFRVTQQRGRLHPGPGRIVVTTTVHPSSILTTRTDEERYAARAAFQDDLALAAVLLDEGLVAALRTLTVEELSASARELDVPGRSAMRKDELAESVAAALRRRDTPIAPDR